MYVKIFLSAKNWTLKHRVSSKVPKILKQPRAGKVEENGVLDCFIAGCELVKADLKAKAGLEQR